MSFCHSYRNGWHFMDSNVPGLTPTKSEQPSTVIENFNHTFILYLDFYQPHCLRLFAVAAVAAAEILKAPFIVQIELISFCLHRLRVSLTFYSPSHEHTHRHAHTQATHIINQFIFRKSQCLAKLQPHFRLFARSHAINPVCISHTTKWKQTVNHERGWLMLIFDFRTRTQLQWRVIEL